MKIITRIDINLRVMGWGAGKLERAIFFLIYVLGNGHKLYLSYISLRCLLLKPNRWRVVWVFFASTTFPLLSFCLSSLRRTCKGDMECVISSSSGWGIQFFPAFLPYWSRRGLPTIWRIKGKGYFKPWAGEALPRAFCLIFKDEKLFFSVKGW